MRGVSIAMDLVDVADVEESLATHGARYVDTLLAPAEATTIGSPKPRDVAMAFAAKECVLKLLEVEQNDAVDWRSIELRSRGGAGWGVALSGNAARIADRKGISSISVSVGATASVVTAVAVAERGGEG